MVIRAHEDDTIAAISTPLGEGGLGVIRLSGKEALGVADKIFKSKKGIHVRDQKNFTVSYGHIVWDQTNSHFADEVLLLVMRGPKSYTCEDVVEITAHGGAAVLQTILQLALKAGARLAEKGEFTKRAFLNGRIDLLQAEAVLDVIKAKTELGLKSATAQLEGILSKKMRKLKDDLLSILSHLEAAVDFPDDFPETMPASEMQKKLDELAGEVKKLLDHATQGLLIKNGLNVVITGRPNVGKSSLMNQLSKSNRVIVTAFPGTTRDVVETEIQIQGFPVRLHDTAGIQDSSHPIEKEGIERSKAAILDADLILYVMDASIAWNKEDEELLSGIHPKNKIIVMNKVDLPIKLDRSYLQKMNSSISMVECSCKNEKGLKELEEKIVTFITEGKVSVSDEPMISSVRQKEELEKVRQSIENARQACKAGLSPELVAVDVRLALDHLGMLVGEVITDDVLQVLFSQFCIGK